jgi:D-alanyl-D-alanine carboxypeptidase
MAHRYVLGMVILLSGAILAVPGVVGFSDASRIPAAHVNYSQIKAVRAPRNLVLRSASALVEDQMTGECLVQKQAEAIMPIASITKLMTAMVVLDAKMDLEESITIASEDVDTLRHSRSRLPVNTSLTRGDALLLALMASENRAAHALGRRIRAVSALSLPP